MIPSDNGGPAFPVPSYVNQDGVTWESKPQGMSMRDYFAATALQGILSSDSSVDRTKVHKPTWAKVAYEFADAMLEARKPK